VSLAFDFIAQFPPKPPGFLRPEQNPEAAALAFVDSAPLVIDARKPAQSIQEFVAERCLEPHEIFSFRRPLAAAPQGRSAAVAKELPLGLGLGLFDASADEIARFGSQGQVLALARCRQRTHGAMFFAKHKIRGGNS